MSNQHLPSNSNRSIYNDGSNTANLFSAAVSEQQAAANRANISTVSPSEFAATNQVFYQGQQLQQFATPAADIDAVRVNPYNNCAPLTQSYTQAPRSTNNLPMGPSKINPYHRGNPSGNLSFQNNQSSQIVQLHSAAPLGNSHASHIATLNQVTSDAPRHSSDELLRRQVK